jgi:hypothetical protein
MERAAYGKDPREGVPTERQMKRVLVGIAAAMLAATAALAGDEVMAPYIGNTLSATDANGGVTNVYYGGNHTWVAVGPQGRSKGTWSIQNGDELCVKQTEPAPPANIQTPPCVKLVPRKVGESWLWTPPGGASPTTLRLIAGH